MRRFVLLVILGMAMGAGCAEQGKEIVVIIEDPTFNSDTLVADTSTDTTHRPPKDTTTPPPTTHQKRMSLSAAVKLLEHDLERGDARRLRRHIASLEKAVQAEMERSPGTARKRALNLFSIKLAGLTRSLAKIKGEDIPASARPGLAPTVEELAALARRIEGRD